MIKIKKVKMNEVITFGKFKGKTWYSIFGTSNASYLNWCRLTVGINFPKKETESIIRWATRERTINKQRKYNNYGFSTGDPQIDYDLGLCGQT